MKERIIGELQRIEKEQDVRVLYAVESGSRGWGFPSVDSDWDVRYIYVHNLDWYLQINKQRDNYEEMLHIDEGVVDISGWDLKKALELFRKSNPPLLEWLISPIIYIEEGQLAEKLRGIVKEFFNPKACLYHYLSMSEITYERHLKKQTVYSKKYFYALRPILACEWIEQRNLPAPMEFHKLVDVILSNGTIKDEIMKLLERKKTGMEKEEEPFNEILTGYLVERIGYYKKYLAEIKKGSFELCDIEILNGLFRDTLKENRC